MEQTYRFTNHAEPLSEKEIEKLYNGYWVYVVNAKFTSTNGFISGIPVIVGQKPYDGAEYGIYEKYREEKYGYCCDLVFLHDKFISSLASMG